MALWLLLSTAAFQIKKYIHQKALIYRYSCFPYFAQYVQQHANGIFFPNFFLKNEFQISTKN